jgi:hypothetical protein
MAAETRTADTPAGPIEYQVAVCDVADCGDEIALGEVENSGWGVLRATVAVDDVPTRVERFFSTWGCLAKYAAGYAVPPE